MNLLSLSAKNSVPAADDFLPVLVFVLVKANPPSLLSTVQYVESFYGNRLGGEDQYWWMQLVAGIKKILLETRIYGIRDPDKSFGNSIEISLSRLFFILLPKF